MILSAHRPAGDPGHRGLLVATAALVALLVALAFTAAAASAAGVTQCSPRAVTAALPATATRGLRVLQVGANGVTCARAVALARQVARALATGKPIAIPGVAGTSVVSTSFCAGCATESRVSVTLRSGSVSLLVKGPIKTSWLAPPLPSLAPPGFSLDPFAPVGGGSGSTTV